jgi:hypothetical protein
MAVYMMPVSLFKMQEYYFENAQALGSVLDRGAQADACGAT